jgi:putative copper export protein
MLDGWVLLRAIHLLAMAFFVGGQLLLAVAVVPVERAQPDRERIRAVARRFGWGTLVAIGVLIATGAALAGEYDQWGSGTLHAKLALVALVAALIGWHLRRPDLRALDGAIFLVSLAIVWLGVALAH